MQVDITNSCWSAEAAAKLKIGNRFISFNMVIEVTEVHNFI